MYRVQLVFENIRNAYTLTLEPDVTSPLPSAREIMMFYSKMQTEDNSVTFDVGTQSKYDPLVHSNLVNRNQEYPVLSEIVTLRYYTRKMLRMVIHHTLVLISYCDKNLKAPPSFTKYVDEVCSVSMYTHMFSTMLFSFAQPGIGLGDVIAQNITSPLTQDYLDSSHNREKACNDLIRSMNTNIKLYDVGNTHNAFATLRQIASSRPRLQVEFLDSTRSIVYALFNGKRVRNSDSTLIYFKLINDPSFLPILITKRLADFALLCDDDTLVFAAPQEYFTNNACPFFTQWVLSHRDCIEPLDHILSLLALCSDNTRIYSYLYKTFKGILSVSNNIDNVLCSYIRLYINMLTREPSKIVALNRSYIGKKRDRLSAACFENPKKLLIKSAIAEERKRGWTSVNFAFGLDITHVGVLQSSMQVYSNESMKNDTNIATQVNDQNVMEDDDDDDEYNPRSPMSVYEPLSP